MTEEEWSEFKWTVLVVDDDPDIVRVAERSLLPEGLSVVTANDAERGFEIARDHPSVHLILLDIEMPGEDGLSLLARLRENEWTADIPVIMLTARGAIDDFGKARERGAFDYVTKPFAPPTLVRRVRRAFAYNYFGRDKITELDGNEFRRIPPTRLKSYGAAAARVADDIQAGRDEIDSVLAPEDRLTPDEDAEATKGEDADVATAETRDDDAGEDEAAKSAPGGDEEE